MQKEEVWGRCPLDYTRLAEHADLVAVALSEPDLATARSSYSPWNARRRWDRPLCEEPCDRAGRIPLRRCNCYGGRRHDLRGWGLDRKSG